MRKINRNSGEEKDVSPPALSREEFAKRLDEKHAALTQLVSLGYSVFADAAQQCFLDDMQQYCDGVDGAFDEQLLKRLSDVFQRIMTHKAMVHFTTTRRPKCAATEFERRYVSDARIKAIMQARSNLERVAADYMSTAVHDQAMVMAASVKNQLR